MKKKLLLLICIFFISCYEETAIPITGDFSIEYLDGDQSVPVIIKITSSIIGADDYQWTFEGASPVATTEQNPGEIVYSTPGTFSIKLIATNVDGEKIEINKKINVSEKIDIIFDVNAIESNFSPVQVLISNKTLGEGLTYTWEFKDGSPNSFVGKNPPAITFTTPGKHDIVLSVANDFESKKVTKSITVAPYLTSQFSYKPRLEDQDLQAPVTIDFTNLSVSATNYEWTFEGGSPNSSTEQNPTVTFNSSGSHQVTLRAINGKKTEVSTTTIKTLADVNLATFENIKFGISAAHNANILGSMFSTTNRQIYKANEINAQNSASIDIVFLGLSANFTYNQFISPKQAATYGFAALANAQHTIFVNSQNLCNCGLNFDETLFDSMSNDMSLKSLNISFSTAGSTAFGAIYPRIILFRTEDGRNGAIKFKEIVKNAASSYVVCDIKVQKRPSN